MNDDYSQYRSKREAILSGSINNQTNINKKIQISQKLDIFPIYPYLETIVDKIIHNYVMIIKTQTASGMAIAVPHVLGNFSKIKTCVVSSTTNETIGCYNVQKTLCRNTFITVGSVIKTEPDIDLSDRIQYYDSISLMHKMERLLIDIQNDLAIKKTSSRAHNYRIQERIVRDDRADFIRNPVTKNVVEKPIRNNWFCNILLIDEYHLRNLEIDIIIGLWCKAYHLYQENPTLLFKPPRLVIFSSVDVNNLEWIPVQVEKLSFELNKYPIEIKFDPEIIEKDLSTNDPILYKRAADIALCYHKEDYSGKYLIFAPGKTEVDIVLQALESSFQDHKNVKFIPIYDDPEDENSKIYGDNDGTRHIIIAISVTELFSTVKDISLIIDVCNNREISFGTDESQGLIIRRISKPISDMRMNQTGKTCPGIYIPLLSPEAFEKLSPMIIPEIDRLSLCYHILRLLSNDIDPNEIIGKLCSKKRMIIETMILEELGMVNGSKITSMGIFCSKFPIGIRKSAMLYYLKKIINDHYKNNYLESQTCISSDAIILATNNNFLEIERNIFFYIAVICTINCYGSGILHLPHKNNGEDSTVFHNKFQNIRTYIKNKFGGYSDVDTIFNIWVDLCNKTNPFYLTDVRNYCKENYLNFRKMKEICILCKECVTIANKNGLFSFFDKNYPIKHQPDKKVFSHVFYLLLQKTHRDYALSIDNLGNNIRAICCGQDHIIDNRSINNMYYGSSVRTNPSYALVRTERMTKQKTRIRLIHIVHGIPDKLPDADDDCLSIFSSDYNTPVNESMEVIEGGHGPLPTVLHRLLSQISDQDSDVEYSTISDDESLLLSDDDILSEIEDNF